MSVHPSHVSVLVLMLIFALQGDIFIFPSSDDLILDQAKELAMEAKHCGQYTDTNAFQLECKQCGTIITGEDQARAHAKNTGHSKFEEVH